MNTLQQRRMSAGLSQAAMGKLLGWAQTSVSRFERLTKDMSSPEVQEYLSAIDRLAKPAAGAKPKRTRKASSPKPRTTRRSELGFKAVLRLPSATPAGVALGKIAEIISLANASLPQGWEFSITDINLG